MGERGAAARCELTDGAAYLVAATSPEHQETAGEVDRRLAGALAGKTRRVFVAPLNVRRLRSVESDDRIDTLVQPDVVVACDPARLDRRVRPAFCDAAHPLLALCSIELRCRIFLDRC